MEKNKIMDKNEIIEFLENVVELEKQVYLQTVTLNELDAKIKSLGIPYSFQEPSVGYAGAPECGEYAARGLFIGGPIGFAASLISCDWVADFSAIFDFIGNAILYTLIGGAGGALIGSIVAIIKNLKRQHELNQNYESDIQKYETAKSNDAVRVKRELEQRTFIISERNALYLKYLKTCDVLQRFYDTNIIYGKYQHDFVAVASFLDYFKSGQCSTLGENRGGDGAYNKYDSELLQNTIINKLDIVIENLDEIKQNQYSLAMAISEGNRISRNLVSATERLVIAQEDAAQNSAIAAYNSERAANELNQIKWLQLWEQMQ